MSVIRKCMICESRVFIGFLNQMNKESYFLEGPILGVQTCDKCYSKYKKQCIGYYNKQEQ